MPDPQSAGRPSVSNTHTHIHTRTHARTRLGMSGTNPQALLSPWHRPEPLGFFGNGHDYLLTPPVTTACAIYQRSEPSDATEKGEWVLFAVAKGEKREKKYIEGC